MRGVPTHPPPSSQSRPWTAKPGSHDRVLDPVAFHPQVFQKWTARGRVAEGPSLLFGKALWPALETDLGGVEVGRSQYTE